MYFFLKEKLAHHATDHQTRLLNLLKPEPFWVPLEVHGQTGRKTTAEINSVSDIYSLVFTSKAKLNSGNTI